MKQNVIIDTLDGKVKLQFDHCKTCDYHDDCYRGWDGTYHKSTPTGLSPECMEGME